MVSEVFKRRVRDFRMCVCVVGGGSGEGLRLLWVGKFQQGTCCEWFQERRSSGSSYLVWLSGLGVMFLFGTCQFRGSDDGDKCQGFHSESCFCSRVHVGVFLSDLPNRIEKQISIGVECDPYE